MLAYYGDRISPHMTKTPEGYLVCHDVPIARTGEMDYMASELRLEGDPDRLVRVYRRPEDVFSPAAMASFEGKAVTGGHPAENVGPENHAAYAKGHVQNIRRDGDYLVADLHLKDAALISDVENGAAREVSCGYLCTYVPEGDGYRQTDIRGNHVAVVPRGRAGHEVAIKDAAAQRAGKGRNTMSKFTEAILRVFGMAAHEAENPEEVEAMISTAMTALDAEPAGGAEAPGAQEAAPAAREEEKPAADVDVIHEPKGTDLGSKIDRLIEMVGALAHQEKKEPEDLEDMIERLTGGHDSESAVTVPAGGAGDACGSGSARDAALAVLRSMQPVVAAIEDEATRTRVTDALLGAIRTPDVLGGIMRSAQQGARRAADAAAHGSFEQLCAEQKSAYDARNPHKQKEEK